MNKLYDVIIAGAGPVGLFLAHELALADLSVLVLEKDPSAQMPWKSKPLGLRGVNSNSVEAFYRRGLLDALVDDADQRPQCPDKAIPFQFGGHFAGIMVNASQLDLARFPYRLAGPALYPARTDMERICTALNHQVAKRGVTVVYGAEVTALEQDADQVVVQAGGQHYQGRWLVGCDGGRSRVRKLAGFEFVGTEASCTGYSVHCELADPEKLAMGFQYTTNGLYVQASPGHLALMEYDGGRFDRSQEVTVAHFQAVLRRVSGTDVTVNSIQMAATFTDRCKQVSQYRQGRVLLAGDSAHIHSPLGAQGLNAGIGDALNLGWKLAATIKGRAPAGLIDSYQAERHPVASWVLDWTRAQVACMAPGPQGEALAQLIRDLIQTDDGANHFLGKLWGLTLRYDLGDSHPLVGASAPDLELTDGSRLGPKMANGQGLLVALGDDRDLAGLCRGRAGLEYLALAAKDNLGLGAMLIRPDGIVAWVSPAGSPPDLGAAEAAIARWFGQ